MASSPLPTIAVVTVSYGSAGVLPAFLASLGAATRSSSVVIVADNKAQDSDAVATVASAHGARYLPMATNVGYGAAINATVDSLDPDIEWVLIGNPDIVMAEGSIDTLLATASSDPRIGSVGPTVLTSEGALYPSARAIPSLRTGIGHALFVRAWPSNPWSRAYRLESTSAVRRDTGWLSGACLLVRRSAFAEIGGFDPGFFMYFEDVDLGFRLGKAGYRNVYEPAAVVTHTGAHSTTTNASAMVAAHHRSAERFLDKKYSRPVLWPIRAGLSVGLRLRSALVRHNLNR